MEKEKPILGRGTLLLANGSLMDPNFRRCVVLLCEHNSDGSYGLILNRPASATLAELFPDHPVLKKSAETVWLGGPCEPNRIQVLHNCDAPELQSFKICDGVYLGAKFEEIVRMKLESPSTLACRFFAGYSGWGKGQLDKEMECRSWITHPAEKETVFDLPYENLWKSILCARGGYYAFVAQMPVNPAVN
jgi:putative transcriptional regulator